MSQYLIPSNVDPIILGRAIELQLLRADTWAFVYGNGAGANPTAIQFDPDLDAVEQQALQAIFARVARFSELQTPPDWANWSYQQVDDYITSAILNGLSLAQVEAQIDALPGTVDGMRTGLRQVAGALIAIRVILVAMSKAILYIRNLIIILRDRG